MDTKVIEIMKDDLGGKISLEPVALIPKSYSCLTGYKAISFNEGLTSKII